MQGGPGWVPCNLALIYIPTTANTSSLRQSAQRKRCPGQQCALADVGQQETSFKSCPPPGDPVTSAPPYI